MMFHIGITILSAVFVIGYIFFTAAASERDDASEETPFITSQNSKNNAA